jgi:hypothetical protein
MSEPRKPWGYYTRHRGRPLDIPDFLPWWRELMKMRAFVEWLTDNPQPDLQALVAVYGEYDKIPAEAWATFEEQRRQWQMAYRYRHEERGVNG